MLLRREKFTEEEWIEFLELIRQELNPYLDKFTLQKFGDLGCIHSEENDFRYHTIYEDKPLHEGPISLDTHGIAYFADSGRCQEIDQSRIQTAWGLTKDGRWVVMKIQIVLCRSSHAVMTRERAIHIHIVQRTIKDMLEQSHVTPMSVWMSILSEVNRWRNRQRLKYQDVCKAADHFEMIDLMLTNTALDLIH